MTVTRYQIGKSPFPLITHMTSRICGIPEPILKETKPDERPRTAKGR